MRELLESYAESCEKIRGRLRELSRASLSREADAVVLSDRQYLLYTELWEMERTMRDIRRCLGKNAAKTVLPEDSAAG